MSFKNCHLIALAMALSGLVNCSEAFAAEFYDRATVVSSEPLISGNGDAPCADTNPGSATRDGSALTAMLAWDLTSCETDRPVIDGYRVFYEYDNQVFSTLVGEKPGLTIPIKINIH